jgi:hypothetical protein
MWNRPRSYLINAVAAPRSREDFRCCRGEGDSLIGGTATDQAWIAVAKHCGHGRRGYKKPNYVRFFPRSQGFGGRRSAQNDKAALAKKRCHGERSEPSHKRSRFIALGYRTRTPSQRFGRSNYVRFFATLRMTVLTVLLAVANRSFGAGVKATPMRTGQFIGAIGCKSSSCHGGAGEKRSQYLTWSQQDFHVKAYAILTNARSTRIAETLSLSSAQTSDRCTTCHSPFQSVPPSRLASTAHADEGVSCESCHNAAEPWLRGHTRTDWTYAMRVSAGMRDLRSFYVRANTCVACHQNIESDMIMAGHPELVFELDGQSVAEPKHWRDDPASGARAWLVGQAVALREVSWALSKSETRDENALATCDGLIWILAKATANQARWPVIHELGENPDRTSFATLKDQADSLARQAAETSWNQNFARTFLRALAAADPEFVASTDTSAAIQFYRAGRLVRALDRLSVATDAQGAKSQELARLFEDVRTRENFQPALFAEHLRSFRGTLGQALP